MLMYAGIIFTLILGVLLHYIFAWSGRNLWVSFIAPTNESYFEHLKLFFTPYILWTLVEYAHYGQFMHAFIPAKVISLYIGMFLMVFFYWLYTRLISPPSAKGATLIFAAAVIAAFVIGEFLMTLTFMDHVGLEIFFDGVLVISVLTMIVLSIYPPQHAFFKSSNKRK